MALTFEEKKSLLGDINPEAILFDGYEDALLGFCTQHPGPDLACYDYDKCIEILMTRDGMSETDAVEFFEFNTACCGLGPNTPVILRRFHELDFERESGIVR